MNKFLASNAGPIMRQNTELLKYYMRLDVSLDPSKPSERYINKLATLVRWFSNTPEEYSNPVFKIITAGFAKDLSTISKLYDRLNEKEEKDFLGKLSLFDVEARVKLSDPDCIAKFDEYFKQYPFTTYLRANINSDDSEKLRGVLNLDYVKRLRQLMVYGDNLEGGNLNLFMKELESVCNLKVLSLCGAKLTSDNSDGLIQYIKGNNILEIMYLQGVEFAEGKLNAVIKAISENHLIKDIFLSRCGINDTVLPDAMNLLVNKKMDILDLSANGITEVGIKNIENFPSELEKLDFSENNLFDEGLKALCEKITNHPSLRGLELKLGAIGLTNQLVVS